MTVPVVPAGTPVKITGVGLDADGHEIPSLAEDSTLKPGQDARVDLCVPTIVATAVDPNLIADGIDYTNVTIELSNCGRDPLQDAQLTHDIQRTRPFARERDDLGQDSRRPTSRGVRRSASPRAR